MIRKMAKSIPVSTTTKSRFASLVEYAFSAVPGSAGILAGEATDQDSSPARMPALPGTALGTYLIAICILTTHIPAQPAKPFVAPASPEAELALKKFQVPAGLKVDLWAAEPLLANPVALNFDEHGRAYVCETFRL